MGTISLKPYVNVFRHEDADVVISMYENSVTPVIVTFLTDSETLGYAKGSQDMVGILDLEFVRPFVTGPMCADHFEMVHGEDSADMGGDVTFEPGICHVCGDETIVFTPDA